MTTPPAPRSYRTSRTLGRLLAGVAVGTTATVATLGILVAGAAASASTTVAGEGSHDEPTMEEFEELFEADGTITFEEDDCTCSFTSIVGDDGFDVDDIDWGSLNFSLSTADDDINIVINTGNDEFSLDCVGEE